MACYSHLAWDRASRPGDHPQDYNRDALSLSQITATHLRSEHLKITYSAPSAYSNNDPITDRARVDERFVHQIGSLWDNTKPPLDVPANWIFVRYRWYPWNLNGQKAEKYTCFQSAIMPFCNSVPITRCRIRPTSSTDTNNCHNAKFVVTNGTAVCHNDNLRHRYSRQSQHYDSRFSVFTKLTPTNVYVYILANSWWRHQMESFSALMTVCEGNSLVTGDFPSLSPVTRSFDVFFDLRLNKRFSKQSRYRWFETPSRLLWRHCNVKPTSADHASDHALL